VWGEPNEVLHAEASEHGLESINSRSFKLRHIQGFGLEVSS
jgi:hypothetical protein